MTVQIPRRGILKGMLGAAAAAVTGVFGRSVYSAGTQPVQYSGEFADESLPKPAVVEPPKEFVDRVKTMFHERRLDPANFSTEDIYDAVRQQYADRKPDTGDAVLIAAGELGYAWDPKYPERLSEALKKAGERHAVATAAFRAQHSGRNVYKDAAALPEVQPTPVGWHWYDHPATAVAHYPED